jgi:hypothetical protein
LIAATVAGGAAAGCDADGLADAAALVLGAAGVVAGVVADGAPELLQLSSTPLARSAASRKNGRRRDDEAT